MANISELELDLFFIVYPAFLRNLYHDINTRLYCLPTSPLPPPPSPSPSLSSQNCLEMVEKSKADPSVPFPADLVCGKTRRWPVKDGIEIGPSKMFKIAVFKDQLPAAAAANKPPSQAGPTLTIVSAAGSSSNGTGSSKRPSRNVSMAEHSQICSQEYLKSSMYQPRKSANRGHRQEAAEAGLGEEVTVREAWKEKAGNAEREELAGEGEGGTNMEENPAASAVPADTVPIMMMAPLLDPIVAGPPGPGRRLAWDAASSVEPKEVAKDGKDGQKEGAKKECEKEGSVLMNMGQGFVEMKNGRGKQGEHREGKKAQEQPGKAPHLASNSIPAPLPAPYLPNNPHIDTATYAVIQAVFGPGNGGLPPDRNMRSMRLNRILLGVDTKALPLGVDTKALPQVPEARASFRENDGDSVAEPTVKRGRLR